jgi:hypothetical protein
VSPQAPSPRAKTAGITGVCTRRASAPCLTRLTHQDGQQSTLLLPAQIDLPPVLEHLQRAAISGTPSSCGRQGLCLRERALHAELAVRGERLVEKLCCPLGVARPCPGEEHAGVILLRVG